MHDEKLERVDEKPVPRRSRRKKSRRGEGRDKLLGERFRANVKKRIAKRASAKAGRKAARKGK